MGSGRKVKEMLRDDIDNDWEQIRDEIEDEAEYGVWTTKDGEQIPVEEMTTSHIQNTIAFIKRTDQTDMYLPWIRVFEHELERRKEDRRSCRKSAFEEYKDEVCKEYEYLHWDIR